MSQNQSSPEPETGARRTHSHRSRSSRPPATPQPLDLATLGRWIVAHPLAVGLLTALALAVLSEMPWLSRPVRAHILQGLVVAFFVFLASFGTAREDLRRAALRGPAPWLIALLAWCILSTFSTALAAYRAFAVAELLRLFFCAGVFYAAAYALRRDELRLVVFGVLTLGAAVALYSLYQVGSGEHVKEVKSIFGNHEQFGSFIAVLLAVALATALDQTEDAKRLLGAQALAVILGIALLLARTRSAWIGEAAGIVTLAALFLRYRDRDARPGPGNRSQRFGVVIPAVIVCVGFVVLVFSTRLAPLLGQRAATFAQGIQDASLSERLHRWRAACRMAYERPVTGWGLGSFPVIQEGWTGTGDPPAQVVAHGTGHSNLAHNFWVQWAAETGGVGLALYVALVVAFLLSAGGRLKAMPLGFRRTLLIGCMAATVAACGDMVGAPSYTFPGVSSLTFLWMGLGIAAGREDGARASDGQGPAALPATPGYVWAVAAVAGLLAALIVLGVGSKQTKPVRVSLAPPTAAKIILQRAETGFLTYTFLWYNTLPCFLGAGISA